MVTVTYSSAVAGNVSSVVKSSFVVAGNISSVIAGNVSSIVGVVRGLLNVTLVWMKIC